MVHLKISKTDTGAKGESAIVDWDKTLEVGIVKLGLLPETFWSLTWHEFALLTKRSEEEHIASVTQAWYAAAFQRSKKLEPLRTVVFKMRGHDKKALAKSQEYFDKFRDKIKPMDK